MAEEEKNKFSRCASIIKAHLKEGELKTRKDFVAIVENEDYDISESTIKNVLKWLVDDKKEFIRDEKNRYKINQSNYSFDKEEIMEDLSDDNNY